MRIGMCQWCYPEGGTVVFDFAADAGFDGVALETGVGKGHGQDLTQADTRTAYRQAAADQGLLLPTLALNDARGHWLLEPERESDAVDFLKESVDIAAEMGIDKLQIPNFFGAAIQNQAQLAQVARVIAKALPYARQCGVALAAENTLGIEGSRQLLTLVGAEDFHVMFDTGNIPWFRNGESPLPWLEALYGHIAEVHLKDMKLPVTDRPVYTAMFEGDCETAACLSRLMALGYDGWLMHENEGQPETFRRDLAAIRAALR